MARTPYYDPNDQRQNPTGVGAENPEGTANAAAADAARGFGQPNLGAVQFGNTPGYQGVEASRDEALKQGTANDAAQGQMQDGQSWLNQQSGAQRGPMATEDPTLAGNFASGANGNQAGALGLAKSLATGAGPSQGAIQLQQGLNQASQQQSAVAAGARGSAALAGASANARANVSNLQQNAYTGAGLLRSQDMAAGRGLYGSMADQQRQQAGARMEQANQMGQANAKRNDDYSMNTGSAAVGLGQVGNRLNGQDLSANNRANEASNMQDDANQDYQIWVAQKRRDAEAQYHEDNG
jgi:hypothetical protein